MGKFLRAGAAVACALALGGGRAPAAVAATAAGPGGGAAAARPAIWRTYDMIVDFQSLPRTYTCDQLWYEFHGILLRLGAPVASIDILPYDCSPSPSGDMKSPRVEVRFQLPFVLQAGIKGAPIEAVERVIRLAPGEPRTLHASDCDLLHQIDQTMLPAMHVKVRSENFACSAPPPRAGRFAVTLSVPFAVNPRTAAAPAPTAAKGPR